VEGGPSLHRRPKIKKKHIPRLCCSNQHERLWMSGTEFPHYGHKEKTRRRGEVTAENTEARGIGCVVPVTPQKGGLVLARTTGRPEKEKAGSQGLYEHVTRGADGVEQLLKTGEGHKVEAGPK